MGAEIKEYLAIIVPTELSALLFSLLSQSDLFASYFTWRPNFSVRKIIFIQLSQMKSLATFLLVRVRPDFPLMEKLLVNVLLTNLTITMIMSTTITVMNTTMEVETFKSVPDNCALCSSLVKGQLASSNTYTGEEIKSQTHLIYF